MCFQFSEYLIGSGTKQCEYEGDILMEQAIKVFSIKPFLALSMYTINIVPIWKVFSYTFFFVYCKKWFLKNEEKKKNISGGNLIYSIYKKLMNFHEGKKPKDYLFVNCF